MAKLNPYLNFKGKTEEAFIFYKSVLGGEFLMLQRFRDTPQGDQMASEDRNKIMHVALPIGDNIVMGTDTLESMGQHLVTGNNFSLSIEADTEEEADRLFYGLSEGGKIEMPLEKTFWNAYFGMFVDKFGIQWMINFDLKKKA